MKEPICGWLNRQGGGEPIVGKFWIEPNGTVRSIDTTHQETAFDILKEQGRRMQPTIKNKLKAEDTLKDAGWIRGQVYENDGLGLEGLRDALNRYGVSALELVPEPKRLYAQVYPEGRTNEFTGDDLERNGWDKIARKKK